MMMGRVAVLTVLLGLSVAIFYAVSDNPTNEPPMTGYDLNNPQTPAPDVMTGGQPSESDLRKLRDQGYGTVINLRLSGEFDEFDESALVEELGMTYISLPTDVGAGLTPANAAELNRLVSDAEGPVLVHCGSGDRVGALYALQAFHQKKLSVEESIAVGQSAGLNRLEGAVRGAINSEGN